MSSNILSINEAAAELKYHPRHLEKLIRQGRINLQKRRHYPGGRPFFLAEDVEAIKCSHGREASDANSDA